MHGNAAPEGDIAGDRLGRHRPAATRDCGRQIANTLDLHRRARSRAAPRALAHGRQRRRHRRAQPCQCLAQGCDAYGTLADAALQVFGTVGVQFAHQGCDQLGCGADPGQFALQGLAPERNMPRLIDAPKPGPDLGAALGRYQIPQFQGQPVAAGRGLFAGDDLHHVAVGQSMIERHDAATDLGTATAMAQTGVHLVGEVQRRRAARQINYLAARRHGVDAIGEQLVLDALDQVAFELRRMRWVEHMAHPFDLALVTKIARTAFLVAPMRRDTELGVLVHVARPDLHLQGFALRADHRGMNRAVLVILRGRDVIVEFAGNVVPQGVHHAQRRIALLDRFDHDPHRAHVKQLVERELLALHFAPDAVDMLRTPVYRQRGHAGLGQFALQQRTYLTYIAFAIHSALGQGARDAVIGVGLEVTKRQILQFPLQAPYTQAIGQRRKDLARLGSQPQPLRRRQCARVAQLDQLFGQMRHHQARIGGHGQQHLAQDLRLLRVQPLLRGPAGRQMKLSHALEFGCDPYTACPEARLDLRVVAQWARPAQPMQQRAQCQIRVVRQGGYGPGGLSPGLERRLIGP